MQDIDQKATGITEKQTQVSSSKKAITIVAILVVVVFAALWIWKNAEIKDIRAEQEVREVFLKERAVQLLSQSDDRYLRLVAKPYVWAIRTEIMRGNIDAVNLYANDMVKEKNFQSITVVDEKGVVTSSTNKKFEGRSYADIGNPAYLNIDSTTVNKTSSSTLEISSPIMGFNKKIGTLIINYVPFKADLDSIR